MKRFVAFCLCGILCFPMLSGCQKEGVFYFDGHDSGTTVPEVAVKPYEQALSDFFDVYYLADADALANAAPDTFWTKLEEGGTAGKDATIAYVKDNQLYEQSRHLTTVGEHLQYTYTVGEVTVLTDSARTSYADRLGDAYGVDKTAVTDVVLLSVLATLKGDIAESEETFSLTLFELHGRYYVETALDTVIPALSRNAVYR